MSPPMRQPDLPPAGQRLVKLMQRIQFGRLESLQVRNGAPLLGRGEIVVWDHKFGSDEASPSPASATDFQLKRQVRELFDYLRRLGDGTIDVLEVRHGLPFRMIRRESA